MDSFYARVARRTCTAAEQPERKNRRRRWNIFPSRRDNIDGGLPRTRITVYIYAYCLCCPVLYNTSYYSIYIYVNMRWASVRTGVDKRNPGRRREVIFFTIVLVGWSFVDNAKMFSLVPIVIIIYHNECNNNFIRWYAFKWNLVICVANNYYRSDKISDRSRGARVDVDIFLALFEEKSTTD